MSALTPLLGITMGDATGCGPEIIVKSLTETAFYDLKSCAYLTFAPRAGGIFLQCIRKTQI